MLGRGLLPGRLNGFLLQQTGVADYGYIAGTTVLPHCDGAALARSPG